jgi:hypothetical protein
VTIHHLLKAVQSLPSSNGITATDLLLLPEPLGTALGTMLRHGSLTLAELTAHLAITPAEAEQLITLLLDRGIVEPLTQEAGTAPSYQLRLSHVRKYGSSAVQRIISE